MDKIGRLAIIGVGMPYDRTTTNKYNLCNISSAEIPQLDQSLVAWLHSLSDGELENQRIKRAEIDEDETYCRTTLGDYFHSQYSAIVVALRAAGISCHEHADCPVVDVVDNRSSNEVEIHFAENEKVVVDRVVIATGHSFHEPDDPAKVYFGSPWPMHKLIPEKGNRQRGVGERSDLRYRVPARDGRSSLLVWSASL